jgi:hypothetical protein
MSDSSAKWRAYQYGSIQSLMNGCKKIIAVSLCQLNHSREKSHPHIARDKGHFLDL